MRIDSLTLTSFRSYSETTLNTAAPRVLVAGENGTGKSTLREAIRWLLTGHNGLTDARGAGADLLAPEHSSLIRVEATVDPLGVVTRRRNNGISEFAVGDAKGEPSLQQQVLYGRLQTTPAFLDAVLETEHFLALHHADAKGLILSLLDVRVPVGAESLTLDQLDARYKAAFDERKAAKVRLRAFALPAEPTEKFPPMGDIEAQLNRLRTELAVHQQDVGILIGKRQSLEERLRSMTPQPVEGDPEDLRTRLEALTAEAARLTAELSTPEPIESGAVNFVRKAEDLTRRKATLQAFVPSGGCVMDPDLECPLTKRRLSSRIRQINIELSAIPPDVVEPVQLDGPRGRLAQVTHDQRILSERLEQLDAVIAENQRRQEEAEALRAEITSLAQPDPEQVAAMQTLAARIGKGEFVLKAAQDYWRAIARRSEALQQQATLQADVDRLEALCEALGPNGARVEALASAIGSFSEAVNRSLVPFGWTVRFDLDPWTVVVNQRPLQTYSESERFRVGIAMQVAIAQVSGLSFAIIDRLDMLDTKNRTLATKMIMAAPLEQVFILATRETTAPLPTGTGFIAYRIGKQGGQSVVLESVGA